MELPQPGEQFEGAYQLHEVLGEGGFAVVFRATELGRARRQVAVKILKPENHGRYAPDVASRFRRELRMLAQLRSQHTVTMYSHGQTANGLLYLVFEYVEGHDLDEFMRLRRLTADEVLQIVKQILGALREAHGAGLLHRDIKPRNIRVSEDAGGLTAKLLDFGIAKPVFASEAAQLTATGEMLGTPRYMSPEQLTEQDLSPASDIYSLGVVAYEMLSGGQMHGGRWSDQLDRLQSGHVFSIPELERIGPAVNELIMKMSARTKKDRFQSAGEVLRAIGDIEMGDTVPERPRTDVHPPRAAATRLEVKPRPNVKLPTPVVAIGVAIFVFMAVAVGALFWTKNAGPPHPAPSKSAGSAAVAPDSPPVPPAPSREQRNEQTGPRDAGPTTSELPSSGCGAPIDLRGTGRLHNGDDLFPESWTVHVPANYDPDRPHPVVFLFHADLSSAEEIIGRTGMDRVADEHGFVIIAPTDPTSSIGIRTWQTEGSHDHVFARLVDTAQQLCLDPQRVFLFGHGVGGYAIEELSCAPWVTAAGTNSFRRKALPFCLNVRPVPFIHFAPLDSVRVPREGGTGCYGVSYKPPLEDFEEIWRTRNECSDETTEWRRIGEHVCYAWDCAADKMFVSCHIKGGHGWHGSQMPEPALAANCKDDPPVDFPMSETIWAFFKQHKRSDEATPPW